MEGMITLFPAIDLRRGRCVRLKQGDPDAETIFSDDPAAMARHWAQQGASWLHVVNLDGAFADARASHHALPINLRRLQAIRAATELPIQFGGGIRSLDDMTLALDLGATRVVLGTVAVQNPDLVQQALTRFGPQRVVVGIDARDGMVATHGWLSTSDVQATDLARTMQATGVQRIVYTDISRDGMLSGVNVAASVALARASGLQVIASGGVGSLDDIRALLPYAQDGIEGVIIGQALYTAQFTLPQALQLTQTN
jgi:phosphoribosylformimino-5-aminoimidazole carboxamide ribotide isomerase